MSSYSSQASLRPSARSSVGTTENHRQPSELCELLQPRKRPRLYRSWERLQCNRCKARAGNVFSVCPQTQSRVGWPVNCNREYTGSASQRELREYNMMYRDGWQGKALHPGWTCLPEKFRRYFFIHGQDRGLCQKIRRKVRTENVLKKR